MFFIFSRLLIILMLAPTLANAYTCNSTTGQINISLGTSVTIPPNLAIGDMIAEYIGSPSTIVTCSSTAGITSDLFYMTGIGVYAMTGNDGAYVIKSDIDGVGYAFGGTASGCGTTEWITNGTWTSVLCKGSSALSSNFVFTPKIRLYKTGNPATTSGIPQHMVGYATRVINGNTNFQGPFIYTAASSIIVPACSVNTTAINVEMGTVVKNKFNGVGTTAGTQNFNISLNCGAASALSILMSGNVENASTGLLKLTNSTASGVAIQLLYNDSPVKFNTLFSLGNSSSGTMTIPLQARYYQTGTITSGTANSSVTFIMIYD